jgi:hypothetical protein
MLRDNPPHYVVGVVVALVAAILAVLLNTSLTASGRIARFDAATAAISVADATTFLAAGGVVAGIGVGLLLGGLAAYHEEVADR